MNRRQFISSSTAGLAGVALSRNVSAAPPPQAPARSTGQPAAPPVTRFEELRRGVGMFIGTGGTIGYLVNADGAIGVDSQFMNTAEICVAGLKQRAPKGIAMLLNTHHHGDHTGGNKAYGVEQDRRARELPEVASRHHREDRRSAGLRHARRSPTRGRRSSATKPSRRATSGPAIPAATR